MLRRLLLLATVACSLILPSHLPAQQQPAEEPESLSEKAAEALSKLKELFDNKRFAEAMVEVNKLIPSLANPSFDRAVMHQLQAQLALSMNDEKGAIIPLEQALAQRKLDPKTSQEFRMYLSQLYIGTAGENDKASIQKSLQWFEEWLAGGGKPSVEQQLLHATIFFQLERYKDALDIVNRSMVGLAKPREQQWILRLAAQQSLKDLKGSAETLELIVREKPESAQYWNQLLQTYLADQQDLSAIVTMERAMARGHFNRQQDYYTLIGLYYNLEQYVSAADLLEKGLSGNKLPNEQQYWELLSYCWQLLGENTRAIEVLGRASPLIASGDVDFMRGQLLYQEGKLEDAFKSVQRAKEKGQLKNEPKTLVFFASLALELRRTDEARQALEKIRDVADVSAQYKQLSAALTELTEASAPPPSTSPRS